MTNRSLAERTRAVARAHGPGATDPVLLALGLGCLAFGAWLDTMPLAVIGAAVVGWLFRPEHERSYLEGFADGLKYLDAAELAPGSGGDPADDGRLRPRPADALDPAAARAEREAGGAAPGAGEGLDLRDAFGLARPEPRLARPPLGADGQPLTGAGPTRSGFPVIPAARESLSPISIGAGRPKNRRRARSIRPGS